MNYVPVSGLGCEGACPCEQHPMGDIASAVPAGLGLGILAAALGYYGSVAKGSRRPVRWALGAGVAGLLLGRAWHPWDQT